MGQRTQIIIVEDVIDEKKLIGQRFVTAFHDQWGFGRPVLFDILSIAGKISTGSYLCPRSYEKDVTSWDKQHFLHHNYPLKEEVKNYSGVLNLHSKSTETETVAADVTAMSFVDLFNKFDNNNGGALIWLLHKERDYSHSTKIKYGCLIGYEDSENPFSCFVDGLTYLRTANNSAYSTAFATMFNAAIKYFGIDLLDEDDTARKIMQEEVWNG